MENIDLSPWRVAHKNTIRLEDIDTRPPKILPTDEDALAHLARKLSDKLNKLQATLHASRSRALLLVLQGMDTAGKDGAIRHVFSHISPLGVRAVAFGAPTSNELSHDFLWRVHDKVPALGELAIFNRSHYEDVLVTRVRGLIDKTTCERRYRHIEHFESLLHDSGTIVLKCYLHISRHEQKKRLQARLDDPHKQWKLQPSDFADRKLWPQFMTAYEEALAATSTATAPWYVVPADSKPHRDLFIASLLVQTLEKLDLKMPEPSFSLRDMRLD